MKKIRVLSVELAAISKKEFSEFVSENILGQKQLKIGKVNSEFLLRALKNPEFQQTLEDFDLNIADGVGVLWAATYLQLPVTFFPILRQLQAIYQMIWTGASLVFNPKYVKKALPETIPGVEALNLMLAAAAQKSAPVYFLGAEEKVLHQATLNLKEEFPKLIVAGSQHGYFDDQTDFNKIITDINQAQPKLLVVCMGSPKQEFWIRDNLAKLKTVTIAVGEGGTLDRVATPVHLAPVWVNKIGLEWLWRAAFNKNKTGQDHRLKRTWNAVPVFIWQVVKYKINSNH